MSNRPTPPAKPCPAATFTCAMCGQTMHGALSEEEALAQFAQEFPNEPLPTNPDGTREQEAVCCDDCFSLIMGKPKFRKKAGSRASPNSTNAAALYRRKKMTFTPTGLRHVTVGQPSTETGATYVFDDDPVEINMILGKDTRLPLECPLCQRAVAEYVFRRSGGGGVQVTEYAIGCSGGCVVTENGSSAECWDQWQHWALQQQGAPIPTEAELLAAQAKLVARLEQAGAALHAEPAKQRCKCLPGHCPHGNG